ncbi:protein prenyltransferase alpha subunit repeat-containing protein 1 [Carex littledalei]|uniref:Protein prenyltransferase alpha subunit repeat-containing protein 1 n=1 Tax=Carex littledalei TaxID=544730 RepID=A0A833R033_9POAL|nr:protein prenyltransferase alpha subunit repeat-containing protein 1 [Carex littledalei]
MEEGDDLLLQLEQILENDEQLDEIGFIHPTQFATLDTNSDSHSLQFNTHFFWNKDHKLAISFEVLSPLYRAAVQKHSCARRNYKPIVRSCSKEGSEEFLASEIDLLRHSKALVVLSPNFPTAWNSRKLILSNHHDLTLFLNELQLSTLILSYSPKSECAWSHRRWIIKLIAERFQNLEAIIRNESELVKKICEKFKMNYRAWNHWCWLVSYMTTQQVLDELSKLRKWAELHVADNSCFHFRRRLLVRVLQNSSTGKAKDASFNEESHTCSFLEGELEWNELLIRRYVGREALWMHRRFLSHCWINKFANDSKLNMFLDREMQLVKTCLVSSPDEFNDILVQAYLAAAYFLWLSKAAPQIRYEIHGRSREAGDVTSLLVKISPEKTLFWQSMGI